MVSKNPSTVPTDTSPKVWQMQMNAIGAMSVEQRISVWEEIQNQFAIMEDASMRRRYPEFNDHQILVELVRARYGEELARKIVSKSSALST
ncbi:MAG: hypothetical protein NT119_10170 [Actinobacteria bacterium]|nr:hypothetical protein [Actinomycetota bacterium]